MTEPVTRIDDLIRQATYRRNGVAVFGDVDLTRTALIVLNMQNAWLADGAPFRVGTPELFDGLLTRINAFAQFVRNGRGQVIWIRTTVGAVGSPQYWGTYYDNFIEPVKRAQAVAALTPGSPMHPLHADADVKAQDWVLDKYRFNAFAHSGDDLDGKLRSRGVDSVVVAGTATNICCESTIREAMTRDFRTFMPHDLVAAPTQDGHTAGLRNVMQAFADVRATRDLTYANGAKPTA
jgi:ureidoacrylate peracid hydrolase